MNLQIPSYHVDAFTDKLFSGNPAMVCLLNEWLPDSILQKIAIENNLPATAFLVSEQDGYGIRWFAPEYEIELCGHGTLSSAFVIFNILKPNIHNINLYHPTAGVLRVKRDNEFIILDFPVKSLESYPILSSFLIKGLGKVPREIYQYKKERILAVLETEDDIRQLNPDIQALMQLEHRGIIVTAPGNSVDFVSRVFYPKKTMYEDPMTGSAYCLLIPYWQKQLNKTKFSAKQLSQRGGEVVCEMHDDHILLNGKAILYKQGTILLDT